MSLADLERIRDACRSRFASAEMWSGYFERRYDQYLAFRELFPRKELGRVLELGCSTGFYSALLSTDAEHVVATDIENPEIGIHKGGLDRARELIAGLGIRNVEVRAADAQELPFEDASFDFVFSSHMFGYLRDRDRAVREINRVLRPGGIHFCVVPTRATTAWRLIEFWVYLGKRVLQTGTAKLLPGPKSRGADSKPAESTSSRPLSALKTFPFPATQGCAPHWLKELGETSIATWRRILTRGGEIPEVATVAPEWNPLIPVTGLVSTRAPILIHRATRRLESRLGGFE